MSGFFGTGGFFGGLTPMVVSPTQAANTFSQVGGLPRQRNVFLVRFVANSQTGAAQSLTFAAKSIDRPKVNTKVEELNEYNKKRLVYTGYKLEPIRVQFYDSADGAAQNMWTEYARYYFGDFNEGAAYGYDATAPQFLDSGTGFGFNASNGGQDNPGAMFFFSYIDLFHFYDGMVDEYRLINPRIQSFEPDDLDYAESAVSLITASFVYENLQYIPQQPVDGDEFWEFDSGPFFGNPLPVLDPGFPFDGAAGFLNGLVPSNPIVNALLGGVTGAFGDPADYRYNSPFANGSISPYGNYAFGPSAPFGLTNAAYGNPGLATALNLGFQGNPLASIGQSLLYNAAAAAAMGINSATAGFYQGQASLVASPYGPVSQLAAGLITAAQAAPASNEATVTPNGVVLNPAVYGAINAQATGTAQYGVNTDAIQVANAGYGDPSTGLGPIY